MNLAVITCAAYSDAWPAFFGLLSKFWPDHPPVTLLTDRKPEGLRCQPYGASVFIAGESASWCEVLAQYVEIVERPFLLMQEDFLLSAKVDADYLNELGRWVESDDMAGIRIYPCPGGDSALRGNVGKAGPEYWLSCQATIFKPEFLRWALQAIGSGSAAHFEIAGSKLNAQSPWEMLAWKRECHPWPIEYLCSAITRGKWNPDAKKLCDQHGIEVDWTRREFAA